MIVEFEPRVVGIEWEAAVALEFKSAPEDETPAPFIVKDDHVDKVLPFKSKAPPSSTVKLPVEPPVKFAVS